MNKQPTFSANPLRARAERYATVINLLFARQGLTGKLASVNRAARHLSYGVKLHNPMQLDSALKLAEPLALACGVNAILSQRFEGVVNYQIELGQGFWEYYTRADLPQTNAVGLAEQRRPICFEFDPPHSLIAGTSGAGKSETLKSILLALIATYTPLEMGIILIDPHGDYSDFNNAAHLIMPIATEAEQIRHALAYAGKELAHRKSEDIKNGRIIVLAIDEADSVLIGVNLETAKQISKQARKFRIHLLVATQKPLHADLPGILDNLMNRFIGQLADANTSARVTGHAGLMAHKLTPKGDFLHITGPDVMRFQVAMATRKDFERLERIEVQPVKVETLETIALPDDMPEVRRGGRPQLIINPEWLAYYAFNDPQAISRNMASELELSRDFHELHRDSAKGFLRAYLKLIKQNQNLGFMGKLLAAGRK